MASERVGHRPCGVWPSRRYRFERTRDCRHRADHPVRQKHRQDLSGAIRIAQPLRLEPIRLIDILLHASPMEWAIGKGVNGEDVEIFAVEKRSKLVKHRWRAQRLGGDPREPKAKSERSVRRYSRLDVWDMSLKALAHLVPTLARVDIRTV